MSGQWNVRPARRLWATIPLYVLLLAVLAANVWGAIFWTSVGGTLGLSVAAAAVLVVLVLAGLLVTDARRQTWRRRLAPRARAARPAKQRGADRPPRRPADVPVSRRPIYRR